MTKNKGRLENTYLLKIPFRKYIPFADTVSVLGSLIQDSVQFSEPYDEALISAHEVQTKMPPTRFGWRQ